MRLILNVIWLLFGGLWLALGYVLAALVCFVLIITIPFGFASLRIASYALWPFGRTIVDKPGPRPGAADRQRHLGAAVRTSGWRSATSSARSRWRSRSSASRWRWPTSS